MLAVILFSLHFHVCPSTCVSETNCRISLRPTLSVAIINLCQSSWKCETTFSCVLVLLSLGIWSHRWSGVTQISLSLASLLSMSFLVLVVLHSFLPSIPDFSTDFEPGLVRELYPRQNTVLLNVKVGGACSTTLP